jgi:hypothetical protein
MPQYFCISLMWYKLPNLHIISYSLHLQDKSKIKVIQEQAMKAQWGEEV